MRTLTTKEKHVPENKTTPSTKTLPHDPDGMNDERSIWAEAAIEAFEDATGCDREDALSDLLTDLMHWCDRNSVDFADALNNARGMYVEETLDPSHRMRS
jgi:hypothetical protein